MSNFIEYWYLWLIFLVLAIAAVAIWVLAINRQKNKNERKRERLEELRIAEQARNLTEEQIKNLPKGELFRTVLSNIEWGIQSKEEWVTMERFEALTLPQKYIYTLWYLEGDVPEKGVCEFFSQFGLPLTAFAAPALKAIGQNALAEIAREAFEASDEENETVSWTKELKGKLNFAFDEIYDKIDFEKEVGDYILSHATEFVAKE